MTGKLTPIKRELFKNPFYDEILLIESKQFKIPTRNSKNKLLQKKMTEAFREIVSADRINKGSKICTDKLIVAIHIFGDDSYIKKADTDNFAKFILDAFKGIVYSDDKQVYTLMVFKESGLGNAVYIGIKEFDEPAYPYLPLMYKTHIWNQGLYNDWGNYHKIF